MTELEPPRLLNSVALEVWHRHAKRISGENRLSVIDHDQLALYAETYSLYRAFWTDIENDGTVVKGRDGATVKHPSLSGLNSCRADLLRLARAIPLVSPKPDLSRAADQARVRKLIDDYDADDDGGDLDEY